MLYFWVIQRNDLRSILSHAFCNFFVNKGNASFKDMLQLINFVSEKVLEKTGVSLEKEIKILE